MNPQNNINPIAPCGINCAVCRAYLRDRDPCPGCRADDTGKPKTRVHCKIKTCPEITEKGLEYCYQCGEFPCTRLRKLDERYRRKYQMSVMENLEYISDLGLDQFLSYEKIKWTCRECGGTICVHDRCCISCGKEI